MSFRTLKISRLSSTEVANISVLPTEKKLLALKRVETPKVYWGYQPVSQALPKILLAESPLFGHLPGGSDEELLFSIKRACKSGPNQVTACLAVASAIVDWRERNNVFGRVVSPEPLRTTADTLRYCADVAAIYDGDAYILHLDCRSQMSLSSQGKEFMKSLIFHTARVGDLRDAKVAILRTPLVEKGVRRAILEELDGDPKYSLDQILAMINETYSIWETILRARRSGDGAAVGGDE